MFEGIKAGLARLVRQTLDRIPGTLSFRESSVHPTEWRGGLVKTIKRDGWGFTIQVMGDDLFCTTTATWFGGKNDKLDNGETASGTMNDGRNPDLLGCALPVCWYSHSTFNSPLIPIPHDALKRPSIPWHTPVTVTHNGRSVTVELIDNGPAASAGDGIDLTPAAFQALGAKLSQGVISVNWTIKGGAKYVL